MRRNAEISRARLVEAATEEFAARGYDGARVDGIVARAEVSKNLVYHYFAGKEALFIAVMERVYVLMRAHHRDDLLKQLEPRAAIERLIRSVHRLFVERPEIITLLNSENLHKAAHIAKSGTIRTLYNPLLEALIDILDRGSAAGVFRRGVDPVDLYITISGLSYFYISNAHTLTFIFNEDLLAEERLARREQHIVEVVLGYLEAGRAKDAVSQLPAHAAVPG
jgi:TetR/AcrR family transcriptional regulator